MKIFLTLISALFLLAACQKSEHKNSIKVAATAIPHAEILEQIKPDLKQQGYNLDILVVEDYNTPNRALADKEIDANFFQHIPFLEVQKKEFKYPFEVLASVLYEPMGLYSKKIKSLKELKDGAVVAVPIDPTNQARALLLLQAQGLITLDRQDVNATLLNISSNPHLLKFQEIDSPLLVRTLDDVDLAAITTNFALQAGLSPKRDALAIEDSHSRFVNVVVIRNGDEEREELQALKKAINSDKVRNFIMNKYQGAVLPAF